MALEYDLLLSTIDEFQTKLETLANKKNGLFLLKKSTKIQLITALIKKLGSLFLLYLLNEYLKSRIMNITLI